MYGMRAYKGVSNMCINPNFNGFSANSGTVTYGQPYIYGRTYTYPEEYFDAYGNPIAKPDIDIKPDIKPIIHIHIHPGADRDTVLDAIRIALGKSNFYTIEDTNPYGDMLPDAISFGHIPTDEHGKPVAHGNTVTYKDDNPFTNENVGSDIIPDAKLHIYEGADGDTFTYCNPDAKFHRDPCAKLYIHADGHGCGNSDCNGHLISRVPV